MCRQPIIFITDALDFKLVESIKLDYTQTPAFTFTRDVTDIGRLRKEEFIHLLLIFIAT